MIHHTVFFSNQLNCCVLCSIHGLCLGSTTILFYLCLLVNSEICHVCSCQWCSHRHREDYWDIHHLVKTRTSLYCLVLRWLVKDWDRYMLMCSIFYPCLFQWCKTIWSIVADCWVWWQWPAVVSGILKKLQDRNLLIFTPIILMPTLTQNVNLTNLYIIPTCHLVITYKRSSQVVLIKWKMCAFVLTITMIPCHVGKGLHQEAPGQRPTPSSGTRGGTRGARWRGDRGGCGRRKRNHGWLGQVEWLRRKDIISFLFYY